MLDINYIRSLEHYIDSILEEETTDICIDALNAIDRNRLDSYAYNVEIHMVLVECLKVSTDVRAIEMYKHLIKGLIVEIRIGTGLN